MPSIRPVRLVGRVLGLILTCTAWIVVAAPLAGEEAAPAGADLVSELDLGFESASPGWNLGGAEVAACRRVERSPSGSAARR